MRHLLDGINGFTSSSLDMKQGGVQTTDATPTVIGSISLNQGEMAVVIALVGGFRSDYSESIGGLVTGTFRRGTGGNVVLVGALFSSLGEDFSGSPIFTLAANTSSQAIELKVTGEAAKTINWVTAYKYFKILANT